MRLRKKPGVREKVTAHEFVYQEPGDRKGNWAKVFGNENLIHLELGIGKGGFINTMARINTDINYIGVERVPDILYIALQKIITELTLPKTPASKGGGCPREAKSCMDSANIQWESNLPLNEVSFKEEPKDNLRLILADVEELPQFFAEGEIEKIYLNFSDPWPKLRHAKRRLTYSKYLEIYEYLLVKGGQIHLKTDDLDFFEYSLTSFNEKGFSLGSITYDLHNSGFTGNIMTEYELKFSSLGQPIYRLEAFTPVN